MPCGAQASAGGYRGVSAGRAHQYGDILGSVVCLQLSQGVKPIHERHNDIQNDQVGLFSYRDVEAFSPVVCFKNFHAKLSTQHNRHRDANPPRIVDMERTKACSLLAKIEEIHPITLGLHTSSRSVIQGR